MRAATAWLREAIAAHQEELRRVLGWTGPITLRSGRCGWEITPSIHVLRTGWHLRAGARKRWLGSNLTEAQDELGRLLEEVPDIAIQLGSPLTPRRTTAASAPPADRASALPGPRPSGAGGGR